MQYLGDFPIGAPVVGKFTTTNLSGVPSSLSAGTLKIYPGSSTSAVVAGVTLVADFAGITGLNHFLVDTSADPAVYVAVAGGSGAADYNAILTAGTVAGFAVTGYQVGAFSLGRATALVSGVVNGNLTGQVLGGVSGSVGFVQGRVLGGVSGSVGFVQGTVAAIVSGVNVTTWQGVSAQGLSGFAQVRLEQWLGVAPSALIAGRLDANTQATAAALTFTQIGDVSGSVGFVQAGLTLGSGPAGDIANRVWDIPRVAHAASGTFGQAVLIQGNLPGNVVGAVLGGLSGAVGLQPSSIVTATIAPAALDATVFAAGAFTSTIFDATYGNALADALLDRANAIETGLTPRKAVRGIAATQIGLLSGAQTGAIGIWGGGVTTTRVAAVTDQSGNRLGVTLNL